MDLQTAAQFTIAGLISDFVGAFVLSVDAIGVARVHAWSRRAAKASFFLRGLKAGEGRSTDSGWLFLVALLILAAYIALTPGGTPAISLPAAYFVTLLILSLAIGAFWLVNAILYWLVRKTEARAVGGVGFALVAGGFALQLAGAIAAWPSR